MIYLDRIRAEVCPSSIYPLRRPFLCTGARQALLLEQLRQVYPDFTWRSSWMGKSQWRVGYAFEDVGRHVTLTGRLIVFKVGHVDGEIAKKLNWTGVAELLLITRK
jgi:hypothetical protein